MAGTDTFALSIHERDIAVLTLDTPGKGANILSSSVLLELDRHLDSLEGRQDLAGLIIISGKPEMFIAGADLREFVQSLNIPAEKTVEMCRRGQQLFGRLSRAPFVTVAAIDGVCVGGGAELAAWCDRRIFSDGPKTAFGFPEVKIGLFPGWGGTARAPRIVGLSNAVELITSGESISPKEAAAVGWASDVVPSGKLLDAAVNLIRAEQASGQYLRDRERWTKPVDISETELGFLGATASAYIQQHTHGHYPAPLAALEVMLGAASVDIEQACQMEAEGMSQLFGSPINAALINIFFLTDRNKKDSGVERKAITPRVISRAGVIGAGIMGAGIAAGNIKRKLSVTIMDAAEDALQRGMRTAIEEVSYNNTTKKPDVERAFEYGPLLRATTSDSEVADADVVIEAIVENVEAKKEILSRIERKMSSEAILASNTSTIPITRLAEGLQHPARFCGIHFFNPVRRMKLVEVIRGAQTSDQTVVTAVAYAKNLGKFPIVVQDGPGFLVNRLLLPYMNEALELVSEGVAIRDIEKAAKNFGMPMGPIALYDMVGLDTATYAGRTMLEAFPDRIQASPILPALVKAGRLGTKSGLGFYSYANKKKRAQPDPELDKFLEPFIMGSKGNVAPGDLANRLFLPMLLEATRILEEKLVRDVRDVDLGLIFGVGFPPFKGGLLFWADTLGAAKIVELLKPMAKLGARAEPTALLLEMAKDGKKFYQ